jgi:hypothetical protein
MTVSKVLVTWRDEEENGVQVGVFDVPADVDGDDLDREVQGLMGVWDTVAVVDRVRLPGRAGVAVAAAASKLRTWSSLTPAQKRRIGMSVRDVGA